MHPDHRETKQKFANEVAIADCIETILAEVSKSEFACDQFAIKDDAGTGERAGAERQNVSSFQTIIKAFEIARERFDLAQQIVREQNRLGALQMRVAGHNKIDMLFGEIDERRLQFLELRRRLAGLFFDVKPEVERNLVVAAARRVQLRAGVADFFDERALDIHMRVLKRFVPLKFPELDFLFDFTQSGFDLFLFRGGDDPRPSQGGGVSDGAGNVMPIKPMIEGNGLAIALRDLGNRFVKSSFAHG